MELQRPKPLYEQVYEKLKMIILAGELPYGERVNEVHLSNRLGVSRGPIREALQKLEQEGLLNRGRRNQLSVFKPTKKDMIEIYQCRKVLESLAAELAAMKITKQEKKELKLIVEKTNKIINHPEKKQRNQLFISANSDFHDFIIKLSGNERLQAQLTQLRLLTYFYRSFNAVVEKRKKIIYEDHLAIYKAIEQENSNLAALLMKEHIDRDLQHLISIYQEE